MTEAQEKAIKAANRAMRKLGAAGLVLAGIDSSLIAFDKTEYYRISSRGGSIPLAPSEIINELEYAFIDAPYLDGGGT